MTTLLILTCENINLLLVEVLRSGKEETLAPDLSKNRLIQNGGDYFDFEKARSKTSYEKGIHDNFLKWINQ